MGFPEVSDCKINWKLVRSVKASLLKWFLCWIFQEWHFEKRWPSFFSTGRFKFTIPFLLVSLCLLGCTFLQLSCVLFLNLLCHVQLKKNRVSGFMEMDMEEREGPGIESQYFFGTDWNVSSAPSSESIKCSLRFVLFF